VPESLPSALETDAASHADDENRSPPRGDDTEPASIGAVTAVHQPPIAQHLAVVAGPRTRQLTCGALRAGNGAAVPSSVRRAYRLPTPA
jgi:hypothetical protein